MHVMAAKATAFLEAATPEFKAYQEQVLKNAVVMTEVLIARGLRIISGRTESHVFLVDLRAKGLTGKVADAALGLAHITVNKNAIPNDPESPFVTSGIRLGSPAITTRGFKEEEAKLVANLVADVLDNPEDEATINTVKEKVHSLTSRFPVYSAKDSKNS
jgi:glycine hydroxymethyltransferase